MVLAGTIMVAYEIWTWTNLTWIENGSSYQISKNGGFLIKSWGPLWWVLGNTACHAGFFYHISSIKYSCHCLFIVRNTHPFSWWRAIDQSSRRIGPWIGMISHEKITWDFKRGGEGGRRGELRTFERLIMERREVIWAYVFCNWKGKKKKKEKKNILI